MAKDPLWSFVRKVQGFSKKPMELLIENYQLFQQVQGAAGRPSFARNPTPTARYLSVGERTAVGTGPSVIQQIGGAGVVPSSLERELQTEQRQTGDRTPWELAATSTNRNEALEYVRRQKQLNAAIDLTQPETLGSGLFSPLLDGAVDEARELVENTLLQLPMGLSRDVMMMDPLFQVSFARLVTFRIQISDFFAPTRNGFDANEHRILVQQNFLLRSMEAFRWSSGQQTFYKVPAARRGRPSSSSLTSRSALLLPTATGSARPPGLVLPRWT